MKSLEQFLNEFASTELYQFPPLPEMLKKIKEEKPKFKYKLGKFYRLNEKYIKNSKRAAHAIAIIIYEVAYNGFISSPNVHIGKPLAGFKFKGVKGVKVYHAHPDKNLYGEMDANNPRRVDPLSITWGFNHGVLEFNLVDHQNTDSFLRFVEKTY